MGATFRNGVELTDVVTIEKEKPIWEPDEDMVWAKGVCESDTQEGFSYKILQMISDGWVYTDIEVPSGGAVKTSDGGYYTANAKHTWDDTNARQSAVGPYKLRWLIYYTNTEEISTSISLLDNVMYVCFDGVKFEKMFREKKCLQYFDIISGANISSSVTSLYAMFVNCSSLQTIPLLDTSNVTSMGYMFVDCSSLQTIPLLDTSNVTSMGSMFSYCSSLQSVPLLDTSNVTSMGYMFQNCYSLQTIPLLDTSNVTSMGSMFQNCYSLQTIPLLDTSNVTNMDSMFQNCSSLQTIPLLDTSNVTSMYSMFSYCSSLQTIPLLDTSKVTSMGYMFLSCYFLQSITLNLNSVISIGGIFDICNSLEFLTLTNIKKSLSISSSTKYSRETLVGILNNLVDLSSETAQTLTMGSTNLAKLTDEDKAIAINKNWTLA